MKYDKEFIDDLPDKFWREYYSYVRSCDYIEEWIVNLSYFDDSETFYYKVPISKIRVQIDDFLYRENSKYINVNWEMIKVWVWDKRLHDPKYL